MNLSEKDWAMVRNLLEVARQAHEFNLVNIRGEAMERLQALDTDLGNPPEEPATAEEAAAPPLELQAEVQGESGYRRPEV